MTSRPIPPRHALAMLLAVAFGILGCESVTAPVATSLEFLVQPNDAAAGSPISPGILVTAVNEKGAIVSNFRGSITLTLGSNPGNDPAGATVAESVRGRASFGQLAIERIGTGYTLVASAEGLTDATSASFDITAGPKAQLAFLSQPTPAVAGLAIAPALRVAIQDAHGNTVETATDAVTLKFASNPGLATLTGSVTVTAAAGIATFSDVRVSRPGSGYLLGATSSQLVPAVSAPFAVKLVFTSVSAANGSSHSCGLTGGGIAYCWGENDQGELGIGSGGFSGNHSTIPVPVAGGFRFISLSAGYDHTCGVTIEGGAYCWGQNAFGQVGDGTKTNRLAPVPVAAAATFASVSSGFGHTCGVTTAGEALCWGRLTAGQTVDQLTPMPVPGDLKFASVSAGGTSLSSRGGGPADCGVTPAGALYCWGFNDGGGIGDESGLGPKLVAPGVSFASVSVGGAGSCAVSNAGAAYCWGGNAGGLIGDGTTTNRLTPTLVAGGLSFVAVSVGLGHACGVAAMGAAYCWGNNPSGSLGDGSETTRLTPVPVAGGLSFATVTAGYTFSCGVTDAGIAYCWGWNGGGQLGDGTTSPRLTPVRVVQ